jgi:hypothetical protein
VRGGREGRGGMGGAERARGQHAACMRAAAAAAGPCRAPRAHNQPHCHSQQRLSCPLTVVGAHARQRRDPGRVHAGDLGEVVDIEGVEAHRGVLLEVRRRRGRDVGGRRARDAARAKGLEHGGEAAGRGRARGLGLARARVVLGQRTLLRHGLEHGLLAHDRGRVVGRGARRGGARRGLPLCLGALAALAGGAGRVSGAPRGRALGAVAAVGVAAAGRERVPVDHREVGHQVDELGGEGAVQLRRRRDRHVRVGRVDRAPLELDRALRGGQRAGVGAHHRGGVHGGRGRGRRRGTGACGAGAGRRRRGRRSWGRRPSAWAPRVDLAAAAGVGAPAARGPRNACVHASAASRSRRPARRGRGRRRVGGGRRARQSRGPDRGRPRLVGRVGRWASHLAGRSGPALGVRGGAAEPRERSAGAGPWPGAEAAQNGGAVCVQGICQMVPGRSAGRLLTGA